MSYSIALIGCGRIGVWLEDDPLRVKPASHIGGIKKLITSRDFNSSLNFLSICDIDISRLEKCQSRYLIPRAYTDYKRLIKKEHPDIIVIATWTSTHHDISIFAAQNGVKGIVLEKPLALNIRQARHIIDICRKNNVKLVVNHERRWDPLYIKTKEIIDSNHLGHLKTISGNVFSQSIPKGEWETLLDIVGGGPLFHDGTHLVDIIRYFTGEISMVIGSIIKTNPDTATESTAIAILKTMSGEHVFIEAGGMRDYFNFELDLHFQRGRIRIGNNIKEYFEIDSSKLYRGFLDLKKKEFPSYSSSSDPFTGAIIELIHSIKSNSEPFSSGYDGLKALEIIFAIYKSASLLSKPVSLPLNVRKHPLKKIFSRLAQESNSFF